MWVDNEHVIRDLIQTIAIVYLLWHTRPSKRNK